jgi:hypothetical protein
MPDTLRCAVVGGGQQHVSTMQQLLPSLGAAVSLRDDRARARYSSILMKQLIISILE